MITGQMPFKGDYDQAVIYSIINEEPEPITGLRTGIPIKLERIINKALSKNPSDRYQHVDELIVDLRRLQKESESLLSFAGSIVDHPPQVRTFQKKRSSFYLGILGILILIILMSFYLWQRPMEIPPKQVSDNGIRLAVLPLANISPAQEDEYFVDGMTEELISTLSKISGLRVIARTSIMQYKKTTKNITEISNELNVANILEGSVRKAGDMLRITLQLIDAQSQEHLWSQKYDRELKDVFAIQYDVAKKVAKALETEILAGDEQLFENRVTKDIDAYKFYLKGRERLRYYDENNRRRALMYFKEAIDIDADYAEAYAGIADCFYSLSNIYLPPREAMPKAMEAAQKALEINKSLPEAIAIMAAVEAFYNWDWIQAERGFRQAIKLNPSYANTRYYYGYYLIIQRKFNEAIFELNIARQLDPLSLNLEMVEVFPYYYGRKFDIAIKMVHNIIKSEPDFYAPYGILGLSHLQLGEISLAVANLEKAISLNKVPGILGVLGHVYAIAGMTEKAQKVLEDMLIQKSEGNYIRPDQLALIYIGLGKIDRAFECLEIAYKERIEELLVINIDPLYDSVRSDERFIALLEKMGLEKNQ
jgi:TolB-like protein/Tfp pilus assembly protein PilF